MFKAMVENEIITRKWARPCHNFLHACMQSLTYIHLFFGVNSRSDLLDCMMWNIVLSKPFAS